VEITFKVHGLADAARAMQAVLPKNPEQQRRVVNASMKAAIKSKVLPFAKIAAKVGDGSGALSESLKVVQASRSRALAAGVVARVHLLPHRFNYRALAMYINYYYTQHGFRPPDVLFRYGIRHGHFVEYGVPSRNIPARPFLWTSARVRASAMASEVARLTKKKAEAAVKRARRSKK